MGLRDLNSIDLVLRPPPFETEPCKLILMIVDSTSDLAADDRYSMLVRKLSGYLTYVAAPDFIKDYPDLKPSDVIVRILTVTPPTTKMLQIDAVKTKDQTVRLRVLFDNYHAYMAKVNRGKPNAPSLN